MRKNVFDVLKEKYDIDDVINKLYQNCKCFNHLFNEWEHKQHFRYIDEMLLKALENYTLDNDILIINDYENILLFLELLLNFYANRKLKQRFNWENNNILKIIIIAIDYLNYEIQEKDNEFILIEKNELAKQVAEKTEDNYISFKILEYNHHALKGNLEGKKAILRVMSNEFESKKESFKKFNPLSIDINNLTYLLNKLGIRHGTKENQNNVRKLEQNEMEEVCDICYDIMLAALAHEDCYKYRKFVDDLKIKLGYKPENKTIKE